jgi:hypothetical protein
MCKYFSCIIDRKGKVWWDAKENSHEFLVKKAGLKDTKLEDRDFVRIEISPKDNVLTVKRKEWALKVDEEKTLPKWFTLDQKRMEEKCWAAWKSSTSAYDIAGYERFIRTIPKVKYFSMCKPPLKEWNISYGADWSAAESAAWSAAWSAAGSAARSAARSAAESAAGSAARSAAESAAGSAAWSAALMAVCILMRRQKDKKHYEHAKARWEVWKRGYGLITDVGGKLYVYGVKKGGK